MKKYFIALTFIFILTNINAQVELMPKFQVPNISGVNPNSDNGKFILLEWHGWGRKSRDCAGWGLCQAEGPHCENKDGNNVCCICLRTSNVQAIVEFDKGLKKYFVKFLVAEEINDSQKELLKTLPIDEDFAVTMPKSFGKNLIFKKGEYTFDESLGKFGGYKIYLD